MSKQFNIPPQPNSGSDRLDFNLPGPSVTAKKAFVVGATVALAHAKSALMNVPAIDPSDPIIAYSYLGTPQYTQIVIKDTIGRVIDPKFNSGEGWAVFQSAFCIVDQDRNIVRTAIQGRPGRVKEYISDDDYDIQIIGALVSPHGNIAPHFDLNNVVNLMKLQEEIVIVSDFIAQFGISSCVIQRAQFRQIPGMRNQIDFVMSLYSDDPTEIELGITEN